MLGRNASYSKLRRYASLRRCRLNAGAVDTKLPVNVSPNDGSR